MADFVGSLAAICTRDDLTRLFGTVMNISSQALKEDQRLAPETTLAKSFVIESNWESISEIGRIDPKLETSISPTDDEKLLHLEIREEKRKCPFIVDVADDRFWIFHTLERSKMAKWAIRRLVNSSMSKLDHIWLPREFLMQFVGDHDISEFSANFNSFLPENQYEEFISRMSIRAWGGASRNAFELLTDSNLGYTIALKAVRARFGNEGGYADERVTRSGSLTASGTSAILHLQVVSNITKAYRSELEEVEYHLKKSEEIRDMRQYHLKTAEEIQNVKGFLERFTKNLKNLRLFGVPMKTGDMEYVIPAVDLHNGDKLDIQIDKTGVRVILWPGSCGNTLLRLETNLQKSVQATIGRVNLDYS